MSCLSLVIWKELNTFTAIIVPIWKEKQLKNQLLLVKWLKNQNRNLQKQRRSYLIMNNKNETRLKMTSWHLRNRLISVKKKLMNRVVILKKSRNYMKNNKNYKRHC